MKYNLKYRNGSQIGGFRRSHRLDRKEIGIDNAEVEVRCDQTPPTKAEMTYRDGDGRAGEY